VRLIVQRNVGAVGDLNDISEQLSSLLGPLSGEPVPLTGGITNRNFRATFGDAEYVIRRPGKDTDLLGIDREAERLATETAAGLGIAPAVATMLDECLVTEFIDCRPVSRVELAAGVVEIARALRSFHESPVLLPTSFRVGQLLEDYAAIVTGHGGSLPDGYALAVAAAGRIERALPLADARPCHNDLLAGNFIRSLGDGRMMLVDWEYAGMGDPRFDLGNLSINSGFDEAADERLLRAYHGRGPSEGERGALKLMRALSDAREGAWGVVQGEISELDFDFAGYGEEHFERLLAAVEEPRFEEWLAVAGGEGAGEAP
jgi:thiamine kinase-like enzyme